MHNDLRTHIEEAIKKGSVKMRPRWQFLLFSAFAATGVVLVFATLLYVTSLAVFFLRESGAWFGPEFGLRGWLSLLHALPWLLIFLIALFLVLLEVLAQRYAFVYRRPLLTSLFAVAVVVGVSGVALSTLPIHHQLFARSHGAPPPSLFEKALRPPPGDVYRGEVFSFFDNGFVMVGEDGTTTVLFMRRTRLPHGGEFSEGDEVVVIGDREATDTIRAFGIRTISE